MVWSTHVYIIQAFLRIRPSPSDADTDTPYLTVLSPTQVLMVPPAPSSNHPRTSISGASPITYTFTTVFPPQTEQGEFFTQTTLPLVQRLLSGENGLLFTYGVTNSGKTYTIQGGNSVEEKGILPRSLDVIFNSIEGSIGALKVRFLTHARRGGIPNENLSRSVPPFSQWIYSR